MRITHLTILIVAITACGKREGGNGGGSPGPALERVLGVALDPGAESSTEEIPDQQFPEESSPDQESVDNLSGAFPADQALRSHRCFMSRLPDSERVAPSRVRIRLQSNGVGHIWVTHYSDPGCSEETEQHLLLVRYSAGRLDHGVYVIRLRGFGVARELGTRWLTMLPVQNGFLFDLDASQEGSGPFLSSPEQWVAGRLQSEGAGVFFSRE